MTNRLDRIEEEKRQMTPDRGFDLVGTDYISNSDGQLYLVGHFEMYRDALDAKKGRTNPDEYYILYRGAGGEYCCR